MPSNSELTRLHECYNGLVKPVMEGILSGKITGQSKSDLMRQCFEKYPVSITKLENLISKFYIEPGLLRIDIDGNYVKVSQ